MSHLSFNCTKTKVEHVNSSSMHNTSDMHKFHDKCSNSECMPCAMKIMSAYFKLKYASFKKCMNTRKDMSKKHTQASTVIPSSNSKKESVYVKVKHVKMNAKIHVVDLDPPVLKRVWAQKIDPKPNGPN